MFWHVFEQEIRRYRRRWFTLPVVFTGSWTAPRHPTESFARGRLRLELLEAEEAIAGGIIQWQVRFET
jgi:hypothetical protein